MALKPTDMLEIQSAIDAYERKFPRRQAPTAEVALAWRLGKREWARRQAAEKAAQATDPDRAPRNEKGLTQFLPSRNAIGWCGPGSSFGFIG